MKSKSHLTLVADRTEAEDLHQRMLIGYRNDQIRTKFLKKSIGVKLSVVNAFVNYAGPVWGWSAEIVDRWAAEPAQMRLKPDPFRQKLGAIRDYNLYVLDPGNDWVEEVERTVGITMRLYVSPRHASRHGHDQPTPSRRAFSEAEIKQLADFLKERIRKSQAQGRKGKFTAARDYAIFATQLGYGLRCREACWLEFEDIRPAQEAAANEYFGKFGRVIVRWGKANKGQKPKRRTVQSIPLFDQHIKTLEWYLTHVRTQLKAAQPPDDYVVPKDPKDRRYNENLLFLTEGGKRVEPNYWSNHFASLLDEAGLDPSLVNHNCRHYNGRRTLESGVDQLFVKEQFGHESERTTDGYTGGDDTYRADVVCEAISRRRARLQRFSK